MSRANYPVYPTPWHNEGDLNASAPNGEVVPPQGTVQLQGITLREYYAGLAMQAIIGTSAAPCLNSFHGCEPNIAATAVSMADALLAELAKAKP